MSDDDKLGANSRTLRIGRRLAYPFFIIITVVMGLLVFSHEPLSRIFGVIGLVLLPKLLYDGWRGWK